MAKSKKTDPETYFGKGGLKAMKLTRAVLAASGGIRHGLDDRLWSYRGGVWRPDNQVADRQVAWLLGDAYRPGHAHVVDRMLRAGLAEPIAGSPTLRWINFRNGLLDWKTGELHPHDPDTLSVTQLTVDWQPDASCPRADRFVESIMPPDMIGTWWEIVGYMLLSGNPLQRAFMFVGEGANGKGTTLRLVGHILGAANAVAVDLHSLTDDRFAGAELFGAAANLAGDIDAKYITDTGRFKAITGQDEIQAQHKYGHPFRFTPWAVSVFSANKIPPSADTSHGYVRRWTVVEFPNQFTPGQDPTMESDMQAEAGGVAAKAVAALRDLMARGDFPDSVSGAEAKQRFKEAIDNVAAWYADACEADGSAGHARAQVYETYRQWARDTGRKEVSAHEFYARMERIPGVTSGRSGSKGRTLRGFRIVEDRFQRL